LGAIFFTEINLRSFFMDKNDEVTPFALRSVEVAFKNKTEATLQLKRTEEIHGEFMSDPPGIIGAGNSGRWRTEGYFLVGSEAKAYYGIEGSNVEFEIHWNNPLIGSNSYSASVKNNNGTYIIFTNGSSGNDSSVTFTLEYNLRMKNTETENSIAL